MESMLTAREVAELLGVHENWVYDQAANGELPSYKIGGTRRFDFAGLGFRALRSRRAGRSGSRPFSRCWSTQPRSSSGSKRRVPPIL